MKILDEEKLKFLFIDESMPKDKICKEMHVAIETLNYNLQLYNMTRDANKIRAAKTHKNNTNKFNEILSSIDMEELKDLYLVQNRPYSFLLSYYNISEWSLDRILRENNLKKTRKQSSILSKQTRYGTPEARRLSIQHDIEKRNETVTKKYGSVEQYKQMISESCKYSWNNKTEEEKKKFIQSVSKTCSEKYGVPYFCMTMKCRSASSNDSKPNKEFEALLQQNHISFQREYTVNRFSYDFKIRDILVEINPSPTHNSTWDPFGKEPMKSDYHYNKSKAANDAGFRCIHIFDWDDKQKIINILKPRQRIFARNCTISELDIPTAKQYLNEHHLQGYARDSIRLGLFYNNELVSCMTFGKPRYNKNYEYELIRFCSHFQVVGGPEKLFKYFTNKYKPTSIISYCDDSKFTGELYSKLRFKYKDTTIGKHWYNPKFDSHITDNLLRQRGFDQLFGTSFGKGTSNSDLMKDHGFIEIYDAGQSSYTKKF